MDKLVAVCTLLSLLLLGCNNSGSGTDDQQQTTEIVKEPVEDDQDVEILEEPTEDDQDVEIVDQEIDQTIPVKINDPFGTINRIFSSYVEFQESTDLPEHKDSLVNAIRQIGKDADGLDSLSARLLINVWMYYDPTDFPTREYVAKRLTESPAVSLAAVEWRLKHKKGWENDGRAPFSDLVYLKRLLLEVEQ